MEKKIKYTLMYKDDEVLSFLVTFGDRNKVEVLEKLAHFEKAPYGMKEDTPQEVLDNILFKFFNGRTIASARWDCEEILKNTGCRDDFELSFKGHGLSLSNHYWYKKDGENLKYDDINFFNNKWDDSFARAVLDGNYEALKNVSLNVPDIVTSGWAVKGWIYDNGPKLYKLGIAKDHYEESLGEVLASRFAKRVFSDDEVLTYELKKYHGKYASVSSSMLSIDEELVPLSDVLPFELYSIYRQRNTDRKYTEQFFKKIEEYGFLNFHTFFVKISCLKNLCFVNDIHFDNISIIRNLSTGQIRIAPIYDLAGAFGGGRIAKEFLSNMNKGTFMLIYYIYGNFDPTWDYSWYDKDKLIGFEDEIRDVLSLSDFYTPELINNIITVYQHQKASLDEVSSKAKK